MVWWGQAEASLDGGRGAEGPAPLSTQEALSQRGAYSPGGTSHCRGTAHCSWQSVRMLAHGVLHALPKTQNDGAEHLSRC